MKTITGNWQTRQVWIDGEELEAERSQKLWNHSPDKFNWGYGGSGPAQLSLALLLEFGLSDEEAVKHHQQFKFDVIAGLPQRNFELYAPKVQEWISKNT